MSRYKVNFEDHAPRLYIDCKFVGDQLTGGDLIAVGYRDVINYLKTIKKASNK